MPKKTLLPSSRRHILTYDEDWEYLESRFGHSSPNPQGAGPIIREIVHLYVKKLRAQEREKLEKQNG